jgi:hypothetical protein
MGASFVLWVLESEQSKILNFDGLHWNEYTHSNLAHAIVRYTEAKWCATTLRESGLQEHMQSFTNGVPVAATRWPWWHPVLHCAHFCAAWPVPLRGLSTTGALFSPTHYQYQLTTMAAGLCCSQKHSIITLQSPLDNTQSPGQHQLLAMHQTCAMHQSHAMHQL